MDLKFKLASETDRHKQSRIYEKESIMKYTYEELSEALRSIESTTSKCEKALLKLRDGSPQQTLTVRRIKAFKIAMDLIEREMVDLDYSD